MINCAFIPKLEIFNVLPELIEDIYGIDQERIVEQTKPIFDKLCDNITCFIEYPYVEKYYRDSYYSFFSKKHRPYNRNSVRIAFFNDELDTKNYFNNDSNEEIEKLFYGFVTLRPTTYKITGHSFIDPRALKDNLY